MWLDVLTVLATGIGLILLVPVGVLLLQVLSAISARPLRARTVVAPSRPFTVAVLVPAHDEALGITATLDSIRPQLLSHDRLIVVADNCTDKTAIVAARAGAEVVERCDAQRRGKGHALNFGVRFLELKPPDVVLIVDADCLLHPGSLEQLAGLCVSNARPAQALYLMDAPPGAALTSRIAAFAWLLKNKIRPLGYARLGFPCPLMGTGMAFPWQVIRDARLASSHLAEDMNLGVELANTGAPAVFCVEALVTSTFPTHAKGIADQRSRWERGHLQVIVDKVPLTFWRGIVSGRVTLIAMALDVAVPPVTILVLALSVHALVSGVLVALGSARHPLFLAMAAIGSLTLATGLAWWRFGRASLTFSELLSAPAYVLRKLPLYARFRGANGHWVRASRGDDEE